MATVLQPLGFVLAHAGQGGTGNGELALTIMLVTVLVVIWAALGVVCWIFWRAKKREDAAKAAAAATGAGEELGWRNAPSS